jgi:predicted nuclease of predicted toxin-antitoxin system
MKLKLDENLSRHLAMPFSEFGHGVSSSASEGLLGHPDTDIAAAARLEGRMLLTLDLDFGDLRKYPPGAHPGIVLFRPRSYGPLVVNRFVKRFVAETDLSQFAGCLVVVDPARVRVRWPPEP